jgi:hypothetical protein
MNTAKPETSDHFIKLLFDRRTKCQKLVRLLKEQIELIEGEILKRDQGRVRSKP